MESSMAEGETVSFLDNLYHYLTLVEDEVGRAGSLDDVPINNVTTLRRMLEILEMEKKEGWG